MYWYNLRNNSNWTSRIRSMSSSHIYCWYRCRYSCLLYFSHNNYCCSNRNQNFQMISYSSRYTNQLLPSNIMSPRIHFPFHCRRTNRCCISKLFHRHYSSRYLLRSSTLPLCPFYRSRLCYYRRINSLIPTIHRLLPK